MCEPVTMALVAAASATVGVISQIQSAKYEKEAIAAGLTQQEGEIVRAESAELNDRAREARREQARIKVAAGESGMQLGSVSMEALLMDSVTQQQLAGERTSLNTDTNLHAARSEANAMYSRIEEPSLLGAGLQIGMAGAQGYMSGKSLQVARAASSAKAAATVAQ